MDERALNAPLSFLMNIDLFASVVRKYRPDADAALAADPGMTMQAILTEDNKDALIADLTEAGRRFNEALAAEVREFGVNDDPNGLRTQWGDPEINEKVVRMIEERYPAAERQGEVIFYGPSNITLWFSLEQDMLPWKGQNHGMGGCIDDDLMHYAPRLLYPYAPKAVFFQTGSNDIAAGIPLETILENKRKMYAMFLAAMPEAELIVCSGLPLPGRTQFWDATVETNELLRRMCEETDRLHFLDATDAMLTNEGPSSLRTSDGRYFNPALFRMDKIHLNKKGHDVWTGLMKEMLERL